jgi:hypothetical protein
VTLALNIASFSSSDGSLHLDILVDLVVVKTREEVETCFTFPNCLKMDEGYLMFIDDDDVEREAVIETGVFWSAFEDVFLAKEDFRLLTSYQKASSHQRKNMLIEYGQELSRIFCIILEKFSTQQDLKYILTLLNEIFNSEFSMFSLSFKISSSRQQDGELL